MPIEPQIPLTALARPIQIDTVSDTLANIGKADQVGIQNRQLGLVNQRLEQEHAEKQREAAERAAMMDVIKKTQGDIEKAMPHLTQINPEKAYELQKTYSASVKAKQEAAQSALKTREDQLQAALKRTQGVVDQATHQERLPDIRAIDPELASYLGPTYDAARYAQVAEMGLSQMERITTQRNAHNDLASGNYQKAVAGFLATARTPEDWDMAMQTESMDSFGIPRTHQATFRKLFGEQYSPEGVARARAILNQNRTATANPPNSQSKEMIWAGPADKALNVNPGDRVPVDYYPGEGTTAPRYEINGVDVSGKLRYPTPFAFTGAAAQGRDFTQLNAVLRIREASPIIKAAERTLPLNRAANSVINDPKRLSDPATQLQLAYGFVQALDTFQSTVREGELLAVATIGTKWEQWRAQFNRYLPKDVGGGGAFIPPEVAAQIARGALELTQAIADGAAAKDEQFGRQADVVGVGPEFRTIIGPGAAGVGGSKTTPKTPQRGKLSKSELPPALAGKPAGTYESPTQGSFVIYPDGSADIKAAPAPARSAPAPARPAPGATPGAPPVGAAPPAPRTP